MIARKKCTNTGPVTVREVAAVRVAELTAPAHSYSRNDIEPVLGSLYPELLRRLDIVGRRPASGQVIAYYEDPPEPSDAVIVHTAVPVAPTSSLSGGLAVVDLPAIRHAATVRYDGPLEQVTQSLWLLAGWIEDNGYRAVGYHRELYHGHPGGEGVTELQVSVVKLR